MRIQNQSHAIVLNTAVNLLREHYPALTSEQLHAALSHSEIQNNVQKKLTRRECAELLGVSVNSVNRYIKRQAEGGQYQSAAGPDRSRKRSGAIEQWRTGG